MFSRLEPYFKTTFREAEATDTRQAIREEERENRRKKGEQDEKNQNSQDLWTDSTSVSVGALKVFLMNFLQNQIDKEKEGGNDRSAVSQPTQETVPNKPITPNARAAQAYQNMAGPQKTAKVETPRPKRDDGIVNEDVRLMNNLIDDLAFLESRNIHDLTIPRAGSFLDSLKAAIKKAVQDAGGWSR